LPSIKRPHSPAGLKVVYLHASVSRVPLLAPAVALVVALAPAAQAATPSDPPPSAACAPSQPGFACATLTVPLDHAGRVPGTIGIRYAVQRRVPATRPVLVALSGGPGQASVNAAESFRLSLGPALKRYRLAVLDQRGTGQSGALDCPVIQHEDGLAPVVPEELADCASRIGDRRALYSTVDSVNDLEALRRALGVERIALMGVSYGTFVAQQYARLYPEHTDKLILDSVVGADGVDAFLLDTYLRMPRVLREQCARRACAGITKDPVADVAELVGRLEKGAISGPGYDFRGRRHTVRYETADDLANVLIGADLNPYVQAALPAAIRAALEGDPAMLLRVRRATAGPPTKLADLSAGLNVATNCQDTRLPYPLAAPLADRPALLEQGLTLDDAALYPFTHATVASNSVAHDCLLWPGADTISPPSAAPLPDVPALILDGRMDLRTPLENGRELARELPHARVVTVPGTGHDELDSDLTGCTATALKRFVDGARVGDPCRSRTNGVDPFPIAPRALRRFRVAPGTRGARGRVVSAAIVSAIDARVAVLQDLYAGFSRLRGGGLRGGSYELKGSDRLVLRGYRYLASVRVSGSLRLGAGNVVGRMRVNGPGRLDGTLVLDRRGRARGTIGGRVVRVRRAGRRAAAAASGGGARFPSARRLARAWRLAPCVRARRGLRTPGATRTARAPSRRCG
jgi:pimeloyl-ACP methyl ester carboxylesterase